MPPKKSATATATATATGDADNEKAFRWTPENERKILLLTQGRSLNNAEWDKLVAAFPGTNLNGVKIRTSRLRVAGRELRKQFGLEMTEDFGASAKESPAKGRKRGVSAVGNDEADKPAPKKGKKGSGKKSAEIVKLEGSELEDGPEDGLGPAGGELFDFAIKAEKDLI